MLVCSRQSLVFIAVPKTGTTAIEAALRPFADIVFARRRKHVPAQSYLRRIAPFLGRTLNIRAELFAVIREPEDQLRSWYRYRARPANDGNPKSTKGIDFEAFVRAVLSDDPPPFAQVGIQWNMLTGQGRVMVDHLFAYEDQAELLRFLSARFGQAVRVERRNVSPTGRAELSPDTRARLRQARAEEFALHQKVRAAGGYLASRTAMP
jgi:hypothetical protein